MSQKREATQISYRILMMSFCLGCERLQERSRQRTSARSKAMRPRSSRLKRIVRLQCRKIAFKRTIHADNAYIFRNTNSLVAQGGNDTERHLIVWLSRYRRLSVQQLAANLIATVRRPIPAKGSTMGRPRRSRFANPFVGSLTD